MLKVYKSDEEFNIKEDCAFILGGFDGLHKGHLKLINRAKTLSLPIGILTISGAKSGGELFTLPEREEIFSLAGMDFVVEARFTDEFKNLSADDFLKFLSERINAKAFVCGKDFKFGRGAFADGEYIKAQTGVPVYVEDIATYGDGEKISSGAVKKYIVEGDAESADALLAYDFSVSGIVVHGREEGRKMGFPTINIVYPEEKVRLKNGVYASYLYVDGKKYGGISNFGGAPTFNFKKEMFETYIDGFSGDLYGRELSVYPVKRIRDVEKFSSAEELKNRLSADIMFLRSLNV